MNEFMFTFLCTVFQFFQAEMQQFDSNFMVPKIEPFASEFGLPPLSKDLLPLQDLELFTICEDTEHQYDSQNVKLFFSSFLPTL